MLQLKFLMPTMLISYNLWCDVLSESHFWCNEFSASPFYAPLLALSLIFSLVSLLTCDIQHFSCQLLKIAWHVGQWTLGGGSANGGISRRHGRYSRLPQRQERCRLQEQASGGGKCWRRPHVRSRTSLCSLANRQALERTPSGLQPFRIKLVF